MNSIGLDMELGALTGAAKEVVETEEMEGEALLCLTRLSSCVPGRFHRSTLRTRHERSDTFLRQRLAEPPTKVSRFD